MPYLLERDDLLVVLLDNPFDPAPSLATKAFAQPLESLPQRGVVARTLPQQTTSPVDPFLGQRADEGRRVDGVEQVVRGYIIREFGAVRQVNGVAEGGVVGVVLLAGEERELLEETEDARGGHDGGDRGSRPLALLHIARERSELREDLRVRAELSAKALVVLEPAPLADQRFGLARVLLQHATIEAAPVDARASFQRGRKILLYELRDPLLVLAERVAAASADPSAHRVQQAGLQVGARRGHVPGEGPDGGRAGRDIDERTVRSHLPDVGVVLACLEAPGLDDTHSRVDEDLRHVHRGQVDSSEVHDLPVVGMPSVVAHVQAREAVRKRVVDVVEVGEVRSADRHERAGEALPGLGRRDGSLLQRLQQDVLGAERELPDLVDKEEATVRLEELARLEHERAHRVADLFELPQIDVARQMVGEHFGAPLEPREPEPLAQEREDGRDLRGVDRACVEARGVAFGSESTGANGTRREPSRRTSVDERERMVEDRTTVHDPDPFREEVPELLREARLSRAGRPEEEEVRARDDGRDHVLVGGIGEHGPRKQGPHRIGPVKPLRAEGVDRSEGLVAKPLGRALDRCLGGLQVGGGRSGSRLHCRARRGRHGARSWGRVNYVAETPLLRAPAATTGGRPTGGHF